MLAMLPKNDNITFQVAVIGLQCSRTSDKTKSKANCILTLEILKMINYLTVGTNPPPLNKKIIVKKDTGAYEFDDGAKIIVLDKDQATQKWHCTMLICDGFTLWAEV